MKIVFDLEKDIYPMCCDMARNHKDFCDKHLIAEIWFDDNGDFAGVEISTDDRIGDSNDS